MPKNHLEVDSIKRKHRRLLLIISVGLFFSIGICSLVFFARQPVLLVTDFSFAAIYGENRLRIQVMRSSLALFRRILPVIVIDGASDDVVLFAVNEASKRPFSVIFPLRFASAARLFQSHHPEVPAIILEGRNIVDIDHIAPRGDFFRYRTDTEADFYRAGRFAAILAGENDGNFAVFLNEHFRDNERTAFRQALAGFDGAMDVQFFHSIDGIADFSVFSSVVLAGAGADLFLRNPDIPIIFFSWVDPEITPNEVVVIFNDSPLAQAVQAVRMAASGERDGKIASKTLILSARIADKSILRMLRRQ